MAALTGTKKAEQSRWWWPALALLWSEGTFYSTLYRDELLIRVGSIYGFLLPFWYLFGIGFVVVAIAKRDRWSLAALLALPLGFLQIAQIDHKALSKQRWQAIHPQLETQLTEALQTPLPFKIKEGYDAVVLESGARVVIDARGDRRVSFVQYRVGLDNGLAYVYDPSGSLRAEIGRSHDGLGRQLSGFGEIARIESLGDHWYRCYFT